MNDPDPQVVKKPREITVEQVLATANITDQEGGGCFGTIPGYPGIYAQGNTAEECMVALRRQMVDKDQRYPF